MRILKNVSAIVLFLFAFVQISDAQRNGIVWSKDGANYMIIVDGEIVKVNVKKGKKCY